MTDKKLPAKWMPFGFAIIAILSGTDLVYDAVRGSGISLASAGFTLAFAVSAIVTWRKVREGSKAD